MLRFVSASFLTICVLFASLLSRHFRRQLDRCSFGDAEPKSFPHSSSERAVHFHPWSVIFVGLVFFFFFFSFSFVLLECLVSSETRLCAVSLRECAKTSCAASTSEWTSCSRHSSRTRGSFLGFSSSFELYVTAFFFNKKRKKIRSKGIFKKNLKT